MSTGNINLDILLKNLVSLAGDDRDEAAGMILARYPALTCAEAKEIAALISAASNTDRTDRATLVVTAPPTFAIRTMSTKVTVESMIHSAVSSILITGYSLSDYFSSLVDEIILKSQRGVFVKFFVNDIDRQLEFDKVLRYKGRFLKVYNFPRQEEDRMAALHAKVISVDRKEALITSANLSYHGQEGNLEMGTHIDSPAVARQIDDVFTQLIFKKVFVEV